MQSSKGKSITTVMTILGVVAVMAGGAIAGLFLSAVILHDGEGPGSVVLTLMFTLPGFWLIWFGIQAVRRARRFRRYHGLITHMGISSIEGLAEKTGINFEIVRKDLLAMINKKIIALAEINFFDSEI